MKKILAILILFTAIYPLAAQEIPLIPKPRQVEARQGSFRIDAQTSLNFPSKNKEIAALAGWFSNYVQHVGGYRLLQNRKGKKSIRLSLEKISELGEEGYRLEVSPAEITVRANTRKGLFYGLQSVIQTLPAIRTNEPLEVPAMQITDYPRFPWRGMMLDVSRHFYSVEAVKEMLDLMALYKMNVFHWHLCDNEGWRLEIKKYPRLTSTGAWRNEIPGSIFYKADSTLTGKPYRYGGFYTQEQVKEVIAYAAARNITVVPEIEMPGHSGAALAAYPRFSCNQHPQEVPNSATPLNSPKVNSNYCAGKDSAFLFLQDVLNEVMQLFPSEYIHIGGDEVDKTAWKNCPDCQKRMRDEGLKNEAELQSYFIHRMEKFLLANNKKLLGWDEILEGGLAPSATVMSWRGEKGGITAAGQGHDVVMTPSNPLYFNRYQGNPDTEPLAAKFSINTLERVYQYEPVPKQLDETKAHHVLGSEGAIWTEFIATPLHLQYMLLPRMLALSEVLWSSKEDRNWEDFNRRLIHHYRSLDAKGINYYNK